MLSYCTCKGKLTKLAAEPDNAPSVSLNVIAPVVAALIVTSCATVGSSLIVTVPVCVVTVPAKARTKLAAEPDNAPLVVARVIAPEVPALMVTSCASVGASVIITVPVCVVTVPANAAARSDADPNSESLVTLSVIAPVLAALMATSCATLTLVVTVIVPVCVVTVPAKALTKSAAEPE